MTCFSFLLRRLIRSCPEYMPMTDSPSHRPFSLVLAGGGARGYAHVGVLRALEAEGIRPDAIVGVSMGAVIGVTYALRDDWYAALLDMDTTPFPGPLPTYKEWNAPLWQRMRAAGTYLRLAFDFTVGWGVGTKALSHGMRTLQKLSQGRNLEEGRLPVAVCATDLRTGSRVVFRSGPAAEVAYASAAIAGVLPPQRRGDRLLVDGVYADIAPVDVARDFAPPLVLAVDPAQPLAPRQVRNGFQAMLRAVEICQMRHADLRFDDADLVLRPPFRRIIDTLDFDARRECVAAGLRAVRQRRDTLHRLLQPGSDVTVSFPNPNSSSES
jgi:NTE family protein